MCMMYRVNGSVTNVCEVRIVNHRNKHMATCCDRTLQVLKKGLLL